MFGFSRSFSSGMGSGSQGKLVTSSATADTLGSAATLISSTEEDSVWIDVAVTDYDFVAANPVDFLMDILVDSEIVIEGFIFSSDNSEPNYSRPKISLPLRIAAGSQVDAQLQSDTASADAVNVIIQLFVPSPRSFRGYGEVVSLGVDKTNTRSTIAPDPGGTINTKGAWTAIEASSEGFHGFCLSFNANGNTGRDSANWVYDIGVSTASGTVDVIAADIPVNSTSSELMEGDGGFKWIEIPEGVETWIRCASEESDATDRLNSVVFHGAK